MTVLRAISLCGSVRSETTAALSFTTALINYKLNDIVIRTPDSANIFKPSAYNKYWKSVFFKMNSLNVCSANWGHQAISQSFWIKWASSLSWAEFIYTVCIYTHTYIHTYIHTHRLPSYIYIYIKKNRLALLHTFSDRQKQVGIYCFQNSTFRLPVDAHTPGVELKSMWQVDVWMGFATKWQLLP